MTPTASAPLSKSDELLVAMRRHYEKIGMAPNEMMHAPFRAAMEYADALIAEHEPRPLSAEEATRLYIDGFPATVASVERMQAVLSAAAERWATVLDKLLADAGYGPGGAPYSDVSNARRIVADAMVRK